MKYIVKFLIIVCLFVLSSEPLIAQSFSYDSTQVYSFQVDTNRQASYFKTTDNTEYWLIKRRVAAECAYFKKYIDSIYQTTNAVKELANRIAEETYGENNTCETTLNKLKQIVDVTQDENNNLITENTAIKLLRTNDENNIKKLEQNLAIASRADSERKWLYGGGGLLAGLLAAILIK